MPKPLDPYLENLIAQDGTRPVMLVEIHWTTPQRFSSIDKSITWNGQLWVSNGVMVGNIDENAPENAVRVTLPNADGVFTARLNHEGVGQIVKVHRTWADSPTKTSFALTEVWADVFVGRISGASSVGNPITFEATGESTARMIPFVRCRPNLNKWNAKAGVDLVFNRKRLGVVEGQ